MTDVKKLCFNIPMVLINEARKGNSDLEHAWVLAVLTDIRDHAEKNRLLDLHDALEPALQAAAQLNRTANIAQFCKSVGRPAPTERDLLALVKKVERSQ